MSCIQITGSQLAHSPLAFPVQAIRVNKTCRFTSVYLGRGVPNISLKLASARSRCQRPSPVCLFGGGKGKSQNGNKASPWNALEKAMGSFKKEQSVEDLLKQQIQKQEYYDDGGSGGKGPGGGGGGGDNFGFGFGQGEDEGSGMWDEFGQVFMATFGFVFLYIYIIEGEEINVFIKDVLKYIFTRQKSIRLTRLINQWKSFFERMKEKEVYDPYWLEREIISTPTMYDSPAKYMRIVKDYLESDSDE